MPRRSDPQRRLVCAQARARLMAMREDEAGRAETSYYAGAAMGLRSAMTIVAGERWRDLDALACRIARRFGGRR